MPYRCANTAVVRSVAFEKFASGIENDTATILRSFATHGARLFATFGHDGVGQIGSETTINSDDLVGFCDRCGTGLKQKERQIASLESRLDGAGVAEPATLAK